MLRLTPIWLILAAAAAQSATIDIKPDSPIASLAQGRDAARKLREAGEAGPIVVRVAEGAYPITEPVIFEPRDSNVSYEAVPGAKPVFVGGRKLTGFKAGADGVWTIKVPEVAEGRGYFEALWVNGRRAVRARTPNEGYFQGINGSQ